MRTLLLGLLCAAQALAQNAYGVVPNHPRLLLGGGVVMDTWEPSKTRLQAVTDRVMGGNAAAAADFATLKNLVDHPPATLEAYTDEGALNLAMAYAFLYATYHQAGNDATANTYAAAAWTGFQSPYLTQTVSRVSSIAVSSSVATATLTAAASPPLSAGAVIGIWGCATDALCGARMILSVPDATHFTFDATSVANGTYSEAGLMASTLWLQADEKGGSGNHLAKLAFYYDWCLPWLVANGHDTYIRDNIIAAAHSIDLSKASSQWGTAVSEADFHNYNQWHEVGLLAAGPAIHGDDAYGETLTALGAGLFWQGVTAVNPGGVGYNPTYNIKASADALTNGVMNWEGSRYWRSGAGTRFIPFLEAFDAATNRTNGIWTTQFPNAKQSGLYRIYGMRPDGKLTPFGDANNGDGLSGRDNFGIAVLNDRFPDAHFPWMMDTAIVSWDSGSGGLTGLVWKLIFYPYVNGPGSHDPTDLPLAAAFGPDIVIRSGWGPTSTFMAYTSSLPGVYHRHANAGSFSIYKGSLLAAEPNYPIAAGPYHDGWTTRTGANLLTIYDSTDCWKDNGGNCGENAWGMLLVNDGGQRRTNRRYTPPFSSYEYYIARLWSGTMQTNGTYAEVFPVILPTFKAGTNYEYIRNDLTKAYTNAYSGSGNNSHARTPTAAGSVVRQVVHFQASLGALDPFVIFDKVVATDANFTKSWLLHTVGTPQVGGTFTAATAGITANSNTTVMRADNGTGRLYVNSLLPVTPTLKTVGGNNCAAVKVTGCTKANPMVCTTAVAHGLAAGAVLQIETQVNGYDPWTLDGRAGGNYTVASENLTATTLSLRYASNQNLVNSSGFAATFAQSYSSGHGAPSGPVNVDGQVYYNLDATAPNNSWQGWMPNSWFPLTGYGTGRDGVYLTKASSCDWSAWVDQVGPQGSAGANLWYPGADSTTGAPDTPQWTTYIRPSVAQTTDYFLNVLTATTTSAGSAPSSSLISSSDTYAAMVADSGGYYVAAFAAAPGLNSMSYTVTHAGTGKHVVTGLTAGVYSVLQGGVVIASGLTVADDTSLTFTETGGGILRVESGSPSGGAPGMTVSSGTLVSGGGPIR